MNNLQVFEISVDNIEVDISLSTEFNISWINKKTSADQANTGVISYVFYSE